MGEAYQSSVEFSEMSRSSCVAGEICTSFWKEGPYKVVLEGLLGYYPLGWRGGVPQGGVAIEIG